MVVPRSSKKLSDFSGRAVYVNLTGGLGNQLFQLAAGLVVAGPDPLFMVPTFGSPRVLPSGTTAIGGANLPSNVHLADFERQKSVTWLLTRAINLQLRMSMSVGNLACATKLLDARERMLWLLASALTGSSVPIFASSDVGFDPRLLEFDKGKGVFLIGYFQSWRYLAMGNVLETIRSIVLADAFSAVLDGLATRAKQVSPLIVHIRRGDYRGDATIGLLSAEYYRDAVELALESGEVGEVWVFSDEPETARHLVRGVVPRVPTLFVDEVYESLTSLEVLRVMTLGHSFVLSNSSFSWWAATLSESDGMKFAPDPWFAKRRDPRDLCPPTWQRIQGHGSERVGE